MDFFNTAIGILLIILGVYLVRLTEEIITNNKEGKYTSKLGAVGIGSVMLGVIIIIRELNIFLFME
ncbi:MAG: hypothetical protein IMY67_02750 [Bacteroidetes bacterium]|nr:hypothetical protein [Bacteroidota bacterium]